MKDPLFTCDICGVQSTIKETIEKSYCHNLHTSSHSGNISSKKKPPSSPKGMPFSKWRKMFYEREKTDN